MEQLLVDTLRALREAEQLLVRLPQGPDHDRVRAAVVDLRDLYLGITAPQAPTPARIKAASMQVGGIVAMMAEVRTRLGISA